MKVGIIGSGEVAQSLAKGFLKHGHAVTLGTRDPGKLADFTKKNPKARVDSVPAAAAFGKIAVLAVKGDAASAAVRSAEGNLAGKTVLDTTNPIAGEPPSNGVLKFFTSLDDSLLERLQREFPDVKFVKAFNSVGSALMIHPQLRGGPPTMFICGNDATAKQVVRQILDQFGWETADMGKVESARAIEPLCMLWCLPGFLRNEWSHAFKLLT